MAKEIYIKSKEGLNQTSELIKTETKNLESIKESLTSALSNIQSYESVDFTSATSSLKTSMNNVYSSMKVLSQNISNYITTLESFDVDDFKDIDVKVKATVSQSEPITVESPQVQKTTTTTSSVAVPTTAAATTAAVTTTAASTTSGAGAGKAVKTVTLPNGYGKTKTYMGWQLITSKTSPQYKLKDAAGQNFDEEGFGKIDGRYVVATTTTYGKVGDYIDVYQADGTVIKCIIGDIKNQNDAGCNKWGHLNGACVVEFVVDKTKWYGKPMHANPGTKNCHPEWSQSVTKVVNRGNYFDKN